MPSLPLATQADAVRLGYTLAAGREMEMLARASARIRRVAGQQISSTTSTVRYTVENGMVTLLSPPVTAVTSVVKLAEDGGATLTGWRWDGGTRVHCIPWCGQVNITYTHGLVTSPDELVDLVCSVASRLGAASDGSGMEAGVRSESIDDYSVTYAAEALTMASDLLEGEKEALRQILGSPPSAYVVRVR
jgi:hypothetical protein